MSNIFLVLILAAGGFTATIDNVIYLTSAELAEIGCFPYGISHDDLRTAEADLIAAHEANGFGGARAVSIRYGDVSGFGITVYDTDRNGKERITITITNTFLDPAHPNYQSPIIRSVIAHETAHLLNQKFEIVSGETAAQYASIESLARLADRSLQDHAFFIASLNFNFVMANAYNVIRSKGDPIAYIDSIPRLPECYKAPMRHATQSYIDRELLRAMEIYYDVPTRTILKRQHDLTMTGMNLGSGTITLDDTWRELYELDVAH